MRRPNGYAGTGSERGEAGRFENCGRGHAKEGASGGDGEIGGATGTSSVGYSFAVCNSPVLGGVFSEAFTYARANDRQQSVRKDGGRSEMDLLDIR